MHIQRTLLAISLTLFALAAFAADPTTGYHYTGTIGTYPVQMDLDIAGTTVTGSYWYEHSGQPALPWIGPSLALDGKMNSEGAAILAENTYDVKENETETGTFTGNFSTDQHTFTGTWSPEPKPKDKPSAPLPVSLTAITDYRSIVTKQDNVSLEGTYVTALAAGAAWDALNKETYGRVADALQKFLMDNAAGIGDPNVRIIADNYDMQVAYYSPTLVSLRCDIFWDTSGAHPNTEYDAVTYAMDADTPRELSLDDLFDAKTDYRKVLFDRTFADLKKQAKERAGVEQNPDIVDKGDHPLAPWTLSPTAITFIYQRYAAYSYAMGDFFVTIPYADLKPYIRKDGALAQWVK